MIRGAAGLGYDDNQSMARFNGLRLFYTSFTQAGSISQGTVHLSSCQEALP